MEIITLEQSYFVAQIVAAIAVVLSLVYVGLGVRQNARAVRLSTVQTVSQEIRDVAQGWASQEHLADAMHKGMADPTIEGREKLLYYASMASLIRVAENAYLQNQAGALDGHLWAGIERQYADLMSTPGAQAWWSARRHWFSDEFQRFVQTRLVEKIPATDFATTWGTLDSKSAVPEGD